MQTMIIVRLKGGLGNQLFQYAVGRRIAIDKGVPLKLDISGFDVHRTPENVTPRRYELHHFNISAEIASGEEVALVTGSNLHGYQGYLWHFFQRLLPYYKRSIVPERGAAFDPNLLRVSRNVYLDGYWASEKYFGDIAPVIRQDFTFKYLLEGANAELADRIAECNSVSLHIRRGDFVSNPVIHAFHGVLSLDYYLAAAKRIKELVTSPHFFVFSDDIAWGKDNLVIGAPVTFVEGNQGERDDEDLRLMSLCKHHIIANSTFSWWGAWLSKHEEKIVIAPRRWANHPSLDTQDLFPANWHQL